MAVVVPQGVAGDDNNVEQKLQFFSLFLIP
jgi:hypothetical protein